MNSLFDIAYVVIDPATQKTEFETEDRLIAEIHYEKGYTVYERHTTITKLSPFTQTRLHTVLQWHDDESDNINPEIEEK